MRRGGSCSRLGALGRQLSPLYCTASWETLRLSGPLRRGRKPPPRQGWQTDRVASATHVPSVNQRPTPSATHAELIGRLDSPASYSESAERHTLPPAVDRTPDLLLPSVPPQPPVRSSRLCRRCCWAGGDSSGYSRPRRQIRLGGFSSQTGYGRQLQSRPSLAGAPGSRQLTRLVWPPGELERLVGT